MARLLFLLVFVASITTESYSQAPITIQGDGCVPGGVQQVTITPTAFRGNGLNMPSKEYLKILVIMAQFPDDQYDPNNQEWPLNVQGGPQPAPVWVQNAGSLFTPVANFTAQGMNPMENSVSDFFYEMTQVLPEADRLRIYGDVVHYVFPMTREQMRTWNPNNQAPARGMSIEEAMDIIINGVPGGPAGIQLPQGANWATYDNWNSPWYYTHSLNNDPEKYLDMVIVCWRDITRSPNLSAEQKHYLEDRDWDEPTRAHWAMGAMGDIVTNDGHKIRVGFGPGVGGQNGSSIWFNNFLDQRSQRSTGVPEYYFRGLVHEIGHHLLGDHVYGSGQTLIANSDNRAYTPTAWEMAELGWITPTIVSKGVAFDQTVQLGDLITTGDAMCVEIDAASNKWFMLENHQMINKYDFMAEEDDIREDSKGVYVLYHQNKTQAIQSATGSRGWNVVRGYPIWEQVVPVFEPGTLDPIAGYTRSEIAPISSADQQTYGIVDTRGNPKFNHAIYWFVDPTDPSKNVNLNYFEGGSSGDEHQLCTTGDWGITTNPRSHWYHRTLQVAESSETSFRLLSLDGSGTFTMRVANDNLDITPPTRVADITDIPSNELEVIIGTHDAQTKIVNISWTASISDPDFDHFLITGGDSDVTALTTARSENIEITIPPNTGYTERTIDLYTVDASGNVSCNASSGSITVRVFATIENEQKAGHSQLQHALNSRQNIDVRMWPQPFTDDLNLMLTGKHRVLGVTIGDASGRELHSDVRVVTGVYNTQVRIRPVDGSAGLYVVRIELADGTVIQQPVYR